MLNRFALSGVEFVSWWAVQAPKRLFITAKRMFILTNYQLGSGLNLRLLFTPLFRDYTVIGRFMGIIVRSLIIISSIPVLLVLGSLVLMLPLAWYLTPLVLFYYLQGWFILAVLFVYFARRLLDRTVTTTIISEATKDNKLDTFTPLALYYYELLEQLPADGFAKLLADGNIQQILIRSEIPYEKFIPLAVPLYKVSAQDLVDSTYAYAIKQHAKYVELEHLFLGAVSKLEGNDKLLASFSVNLEMLEGIVDWLVAERTARAKVYFWQEDYDMPVMGGVNRGLTGRVTPTLDLYSIDYSAQASEGKFNSLIVREDILNEVAGILGSQSENILLIGNPGSGKSSIMKVLAREIVQGTKYESIKFKRVVALEPGFIIAGTKTKGDVAERVKAIMQDVEGSANIVLFIDELQELMESDIGSILEPYMSGSNQFVASTSLDNYRKHIEPSKSFSRMFNIVEVGETDDAATLAILKTTARDFERRLGIIISYPALVKLIELSKKLIHDRVFPDKAISVLNMVTAERVNKSKFLGQEDVALEISKLSHVPVSALTQDESQKLLNLEEDMQKIVLGQNHAIKSIAAAMKRARVGIRDESKPIASFLFVGTTGTGKTQTAKALAQSYFGDKNAMVRLDMSEYQQPDSINRLLGSPDGSMLGQLTEAVRQNPYTLILLDEIEKAYSKILLTFLQVLDDGRLTDSQGTTVDFTNSILIATSNIGTRSIQQLQAKNASFEQMSDAVMADVHTNFAPEFINRFTEVIVFKPLTTSQVKQVADLMLDKVREIASAKGVKIHFTPVLLDALVQRSFNPQMGARPMARVIEEYVETYLADKLLRQEVNSGDELTLGLEVFEKTT